MTVDERLTHARWTEALRDGRLLGQRCSECGNETATPAAACPACGARGLETIDLPTSGIVHTATTIEVSPTEFDAGYRVAVIDLETDGGARVTARLEGEASIGDRVELTDVLEVRETVPVFS